MLSFGSGGAQICIVGRSEFASEAGTLVAGLAEALARSFPVAFLPTDAALDNVTLPSGRILPVCRDTAAIIVSVVCEGGNDVEPPGHLRYAWVSSADAVPAGHVAWLNAQFDAVLVPDPDLADALRHGGVTRRRDRPGDHPAHGKAARATGGRDRWHAPPGLPRA